MLVQMLQPEAQTVKPLYKTLLAFYVLFLLWLILFKTSTDFSSVLLHYQSRSLNLTPFAGYSPGTAREMVDNLIVFVPLGLLLGTNLRHIRFWQKLALVCGFSVAAEAAQYVLAIGTTDITDVIMNTMGGLLGLVLYTLIGTIVAHKNLDRCIAIAMVIVLALFLYLRFFVLRVRY